MWRKIADWLFHPKIKTGTQDIFSDATDDLEDKVPNDKFTGVKLTWRWPWEEKDMSIKRKYTVLKDGILKLESGDLKVSVTDKENTYGDQWFESIESFHEQVESGLIASGWPKEMDSTVE